MPLESRLDPQVRGVLGQMAAAGVRPLATLTVEQARANHVAASARLCAPVAAAVEVHNLAVPGEPGGVRGTSEEIPVRLYRPCEGTLPLMVWFHGGGWVVGSLDTYDPLCRRLAAASGMLVASVGYRLAPEHRFPAAVQDADAAVRWLHAHAAELGGDPRRVVVAGDSAGGNLAAVAARHARDAGGPPLAFQLLVYPVTDAAMDTVSHRDNAEGYYLTAADTSWYWAQYLGGADGLQPDASPLRAADLTGLPPALVLTAEFDPLRDEGEAYALALRAAGVPADVRRWDGMIHGFFRWTAALDAAGAAIDETAKALRAALAA
jgi:acetyl esterase